LWVCIRVGREGWDLNVRVRLPGSSHKGGYYDYSRSRASRLMYYFDGADIDGQACLEKRRLKSIDHMDCSARGRESAVEFVPVRVPLNLLSRRKGTSTSAGRMAPLRVRSMKAFRLCRYRWRYSVHRDIASPRDGFSVATYDRLAYSLEGVSILMARMPLSPTIRFWRVCLSSRVSTVLLRI